MSRKTGGNVQPGFALRDRGEASHLLAAGIEPRGKMRDVAPGVLGLNLDRKLGDRDRAQQVGRQARDVREFDRRRGALDTSRDQRNRRAAMLVVRMPRAAGQIGLGAGAVFERDVGTRRRRWRFPVVAQGRKAMGGVSESSTENTGARSEVSSACAPRSIVRVHPGRNHWSNTQ